MTDCDREALNALLRTIEGVERLGKATPNLSHALTLARRGAEMEPDGYRVELRDETWQDPDRWERVTDNDTRPQALRLCEAIRRLGDRARIRPLYAAPPEGEEGGDDA